MNMPSKLEVRKISELIPYENNARTHPPEQLEKLRRSLREFGFVSPVLIDAAGNVIAGHGRLEAARLEGITEAPCVPVEHLTEDQRRAYILADNRLAEDAGWDEALVSSELLALRDAGLDLSLTGFDSAEICLGDDLQDPEITEDDFDPEPPEEPTAQRGQVWQLGRHRLMCGDSTNLNAVLTLMSREKADICFSSPPYNVMAGFHANKKMSNPYMKTGGVYREYGDCLNDDDYSAFLTQCLHNALNVCDDVLFNIGFTKGALHGTALFLGANAAQFAGCLIWEKSNAFVPVFECQYGMTTNIAEPIYAFNRGKRRKFLHPTWPKDSRMPNVVRTENACANKFAEILGATFPIALPHYIISNFSHDSVIDLFGGSGTTLIACEQTGRRCCMLEIDPHYCDVIIRRWEEFTGEKAVLLHG